MIKDTYIESLKNNMIILHDFVNKMTKEEISKKIKDYWTIFDHIEHLVESQKVLLVRLKQFIEEENPIMKPFNPENEKKTEKSASDIISLLDEYSKLRNEQIELIRKSKDDIWKKEGKHPEYIKYNFDILVRHSILHDGFHLWRMEELWIEKEELIMELNSN